MRLSRREKQIIEAMISNGGQALIWPLGAFSVGGTKRNISITCHQDIFDRMVENELIEGYPPFMLLTKRGREAWRRGVYEVELRVHNRLLLPMNKKAGTS